MRITALVDDVARSGYEAEHGLSLFIECEGEKILFDFGASAAFMRNAAISGADISAADYAILSHDHYKLLRGESESRSLRRARDIRRKILARRSEVRGTRHKSEGTFPRPLRLRGRKRETR